ncbi:MAG: hypothetical protein ABI193_10565, partial [Minicystis sp.]
NARADDELIKAVAHAEQELRDDGEHTNYRFPLTLSADVEATKLVVLTVRASQGGRADAGLLGAFRPTLVAAPGSNAELVIEVDLKIASTPATYEIELLVTRGGEAGKAVSQKLAVKLIHPGASLKPPAPLVVSRTWPPFLHAIYPSDVTLTEISKKSRVTGLSITQPEAPLRGSDPVGGRLILAPPAEIKPGESASLTISTDGSFPVGSTRGKLEIRAAQLLQPVMLDYEMRVRLSSLFIPLVFLAGAGIGNLTRTRLKRREEKLDRRQRADELRARLTRLAARSTDEVRVELERVADLLSTERDEALEKAISEGKDLQEKTLADRKGRQRELITASGRAIAILDRGFLLPPTLALGALREAFGEANRSALDDDIVSANTALDGAQKRARELTRSGRAWALEVKQELALLITTKPPGLDALTAARPDLEAGIGAVRALTEDDELEPLLRAVHAANEAILDQTWALSRSLARMAEDAAGAGPEGALIRAAAEMPADPTVETDAHAALVRLCRATRAVEREVRALVEAMLPAMADRKAVSPLLDEHRFDEAAVRAREMVAGRAAPSGLEGTGPISSADLDEGVPPKPPVPSPAASGVAPRARLLAPVVRDSVLILAAGAAEKASEEASKQLETTRSARTVITALILAAMAWTLYEQDFFGTGRELLGLFALGFTSDLSADALFAALERTKKA